ncbi:hypothetical protein HDU67_008033, partial [Dinochytrium kinnereticum]
MNTTTTTEDSATTNKVVVAIVGTTGVGKSNLAIELAKRFGGEVINADSMQVYRGLDIATNKVTEEEKEGVPHHLMSFVDPPEEYSVSQFEVDCVKKISDLHSRSILPILVGGTHYYIQSVLWHSTLIRPPSPLDDDDVDDRVEEKTGDAAHPSIPMEVAEI